MGEYPKIIKGEDRWFQIFYEDVQRQRQIKEYQIVAKIIDRREFKGESSLSIEEQLNGQEIPHNPKIEKQLS